MSVAEIWPDGCDFFPGQPIRFTSDDSRLSAHGGLLLFRQLDEHLGLTRDFAADLRDPRHPDAVMHSYLDLVRQRVYSLLADHEDQNDADHLRADPIFKLLIGRLPDGPDLASQPTLSRFENDIDIPSLFRLRERFVQQFLEAFDTPPRHLTFDLDAVDDPAHGHQQLTCWHNYYDQNQYLPLILTCADNDLVVSVSLRHGSAHAALGADDDLEFLITRVRARWPGVTIYVRADAGFAGPTLYQLCERLEVFYTFGIVSNAVLQRRSQALLDQALATREQEVLQAREEGRAAAPVRLLDGFWYEAGSWGQARFVVVKAEVNDQGSQRRFVVSNRPGAEHFPEATYDEYVGRGESENRHKELKCDLHMGRLSDHRFVANYFRLYLHALALNLVVRLRRLIALPAERPTERPTEPVGAASASVPPGGAVACAPDAGETSREGSGLPQSAQTGAERSRGFRCRRRRDVLGEGQPQTWRRLVIEMPVRVVLQGAIVVVELSSCWPHTELFRGVLRRLLQAVGRE